MFTDGILRRKRGNQLSHSKKLQRIRKLTASWKKNWAAEIKIPPTTKCPTARNKQAYIGWACTMDWRRSCWVVPQIVVVDGSEDHQVVQRRCCGWMWEVIKACGCCCHSQTSGVFCCSQEHHHQPIKIRSCSISKKKVIEKWLSCKCNKILSAPSSSSCTR